MDLCIIKTFLSANVLYLLYKIVHSSNLLELSHCIDDGIFASLTGIGRCTCALECIFRARCTGFSYFKSAYNCNLLDTSLLYTAIPSKTIPVIEDSNTCLVSNISLWDFTPQNKICNYSQHSVGVCENRPCSNTHRCTPAQSPLNYTCKPSECLSPPFVTNAEIGSQLSGVGTINKYLCVAGYSLFQDSRIECFSNATWSKRSVTCRPNCPVIPVIPNAAFVSVSAGRFTLDTIAYYACVDGFYNISDTAIRCDDTGKWENDLNCYKYCDSEDIPQISNAFAGGDPPYTLVSVVTYSCLDGYYMIGKAIINCTTAGTWTQPDLICYPYCLASDIPPISFSTIDTAYSKFTAPSVVRYQCNSGYYMVGSNETMCTIAGTWTQPDLSCYPYCLASNIPPISFSTIDTAHSEFKAPSVVRYQCNSGYYMVGSDETMCTTAGTWTQPDLTCYPYCLASNIPPISFSTIDTAHSEFKASSVVKYQCNSGYYMVGSDETMCTADGTWTLPGGGCARFCPQSEIPDIPHATTNSDPPPFIKNSDIEYSCESGYYPIGAKNRATCKEDGTWEVPDYTCDPICDAPPTVANAATNLPMQPYFSGSETSYKCIAPYFAVGSTTITCQSSRAWTAISFQCYLCNLPTTVPDSYYTPSSSNAYEENDVVTFTCYEYAYNNGNGPITVTCLSNGLWSEPASGCNRYCLQFKDDYTYEDKHYASVPAPQPQYKEGMTAPFVCVNDFSIVHNNITCLASGIWEGVLKCETDGGYWITLTY